RGYCTWSVAQVGALPSFGPQRLARADPRCRRAAVRGPGCGGHLAARDRAGGAGESRLDLLPLEDEGRARARRVPAPARATRRRARAPARRRRARVGARTGAARGRTLGASRADALDRERPGSRRPGLRAPARLHLQRARPRPRAHAAPRPRRHARAVPRRTRARVARSSPGAAVGALPLRARRARLHAGQRLELAAGGRPPTPGGVGTGRAARADAVPRGRLRRAVPPRCAGEGERVTHPALHTALCELAGVRYPIVQTGMGWVASAKLVSATANAGGLGIIASATMDLRQLAEAIAETKRRTDRPFGVH